MFDIYCIRLERWREREIWGGHGREHRTVPPKSPPCVLKRSVVQYTENKARETAESEGEEGSGRPELAGGHSQQTHGHQPFDYLRGISVKERFPSACFLEDTETNRIFTIIALMFSCH